MKPRKGEEEGISCAKEVSFGSLASKWPSSHPHDLVHMANLNCMFNQVFFPARGAEVNIQFIIRFMHASYSVHLDNCKTCQLCAKNFQKVGIFD